jgi:hypothetical protein
MPNKWDRRDGEGTEAFEAFKLYRDMGESRSVIKVGQECDKNRTLIGRWSSEFDWVDRAQAYDDHLDKLVLREKENELKKIARRHARLGVLMQSKGQEALEAFPINEATMDQIVKLLKTGVDIERAATGSDKTDEQGNTYQMAVLILPDDGSGDRLRARQQQTSIPATAGTTDRVREEQGSD